MLGESHRPRSAGRCHARRPGLGVRALGAPPRHERGVLREHRSRRALRRPDRRRSHAQPTPGLRCPDPPATRSCLRRRRCLRRSAPATDTGPILRHRTPGRRRCRARRPRRRRGRRPDADDRRARLIGKELRADGLRHVTGHLVVDDSRYDHPRAHRDGSATSCRTRPARSTRSPSTRRRAPRRGVPADPTLANASILGRRLHHAHINGGGPGPDRGCRPARRCIHTYRSSRLARDRPRDADRLRSTSTPR